MITVCLISTKLEINSKSLILNLLTFNLIFQRWATHSALLQRRAVPDRELQQQFGITGRRQ